MVTRKTLRTNLTYFDNNVHGHSFSDHESKLYLKFTITLKELLDYVTQRTPERLTSDYEAKGKRLIQFFSQKTECDSGYLDSFESSNSINQMNQISLQQQNSELQTELNSSNKQLEELFEAIDLKNSEIMKLRLEIARSNEKFREEKRNQLDKVKRLDHLIQLKDVEKTRIENKSDYVIKELSNQIESKNAELLNQINMINNLKDDLIKNSNEKRELEEQIGKLNQDISTKNEQATGNIIKINILKDKLNFLKEQTNNLNNQKDNEISNLNNQIKVIKYEKVIENDDLKNKIKEANSLADLKDGELQIRLIELSKLRNEIIKMNNKKNKEIEKLSNETDRLVNKSNDEKKALKEEIKLIKAKNQLEMNKENANESVKIEKADKPNKSVKKLIKLFENINK